MIGGLSAEPMLRIPQIIVKQSPKYADDFDCHVMTIPPPLMTMLNPSSDL